MMNKIFKSVVTILTVSATISCTQGTEVYVGTKQEQKEALSSEEYANKFCNFTDINVDITSSREGGKFYSAYDCNPYNDEGSIVVSPLFSGLTPINDVISVPNGIDTLYIVSAEGMTKYPMGNITISDDKSKKSAMRATRADDEMTKEELDEAIQMVNNVLIPEINYNVRGENLYKCTDLIVNSLTENQTAKLWATFIHDGADSFEGRLWYYTYSKQNPEITDCTFFGKKDGEFVQINYSDVKNKQFEVFNTKDADELNREVLLNNNTLKNDIYLGFVYIGNLGPRFTTPSLNTQENCESESAIIGTKIKYSDTKEEFTVNQNINSGAIFHFTCLSSQYNVVGMENRLPNQDMPNIPYDADYNDCLLLIRTDPETISPFETIAPPELNFTSYRKGVWIFEDNFPNDGDYDFNDVVVAYDMRKINNANSKIVNVRCRLLANGCENHNKFGFVVLPNNGNEAWKNPTFKKELYNDIHGYVNVSDQQADFSNSEWTQVSITCDNYKLIRPYLDNGTGNIYLETFNSDVHPYVMDIPFSALSNTGGTDKNVVTNSCFRWMQEGYSIDLGYKFLDLVNGKRNVGWFWNSQAKDKSILINRDEQENIW